MSIQGVIDGYFDGPRAWKIAIYRLVGESRAKLDKKYYRVAENLQKSRPLRSGHSAIDFIKSALTDRVHINQA